MKSEQSCFVRPGCRQKQSGYFLTEGERAVPFLSVRFLVKNPKGKGGKAVVKTYFGKSKEERSMERMMQEKPNSNPQGKKQKVQIIRCENCSAYDKHGHNCRLPTCRYTGKNCCGCPYQKGICNICYREMMKEK